MVFRVVSVVDLRFRDGGRDGSRLGASGEGRLEWWLPDLGGEEGDLGN